jgi:hypothetical protein
VVFGVSFVVVLLSESIPLTVDSNPSNTTFKYLVTEDPYWIISESNDSGDDIGLFEEVSVSANKPYKCKQIANITFLVSVSFSAMRQKEPVCCKSKHNR